MHPGSLIGTPLAPLPLRPADVRVARGRAIRGPQRQRQITGIWAGIEERAAQRPDAVAVRAGGATVTYAGLAGLVRREQLLLLAHGVSPGDPVAVAGPRGARIIATFLAVESLGAVYVPLDTGWPASRLGDVLADVRPRCLVHTGTDGAERPAAAVAEAAARTGTPLADPSDAPASPGPAAPGPVARATPTADEPRYVIHTSGSTGRPKGALVTHGGLVNHLASMIDLLDLGPADTVAFTAPVGYVVSIWQMVAALLAGGSVAVIDDLDIHFGRRLVNAVAGAEVTVLELLPTMIRWVVDDISHHRSTVPLPALRCLLSTGEKLAAELAAAVPAALPHVTFHNAYGASECADDVALRRVTGSDTAAGRVALGVPLPNVVLHVLVAEGDGWRPAAPEEAGELWVGGAGVGLGYLGDPDRTAGSFFADPIDPGSATGRLYRTGDLVRVSGDRIDYLGRADRQIKVGGMRIELDEIELALSRLPEIRDCAVVAHHVDGRTELVMYYVTGPKAGVPAGLPAGVPAGLAAMQSHLRSLLPAFMVPRRWVALDALPLNGSGKVDRRALQAGLAAVPAQQGRPR